MSAWQLNHNLENERVIMTPMQHSDIDELREIAFDPAIWEYFVTQINSESDLNDFVNSAVSDISEKKRIVYVIRDKKNNKVAGSMAYGSMAEVDSRLEIGWSWLGKDFRGTGLNYWAKLALLTNAFDVLNCERVEFKTDILNIGALKGLSKVGATREGVFRSFNIMPSGRRRDAVYFSIIKSEWTDVKTKLEANAFSNR